MAGNGPVRVSRATEKRKQQKKTSDSFHVSYFVKLPAQIKSYFPFALILAHLRRCAAAILARPAADILPRRRVVFPEPSKARIAASILARSAFSCPTICVRFMAAVYSTTPTTNGHCSGQPLGANPPMCCPASQETLSRFQDRTDGPTTSRFQHGLP